MDAIEFCLLQLGEEYALRLLDTGQFSVVRIGVRVGYEHNYDTVEEVAHGDSAWLALQRAMREKKGKR